MAQFTKIRIAAASLIALAIALVSFAGDPTPPAQLPPSLGVQLNLSLNNDPGMMEILGERLIDPSHWSNGVANGLWPKGDLWSIPTQYVYDPTRPHYHGYGQPTFEHWKDASEFTLSHSQRFPTVDDLKSVHARAFYNDPSDMFWGYYSYQIWNDFPEAERPELYHLLDQGQTDPTALQQLFDRGIQNGRGEIRSRGDTSWSGKQWDEETKDSVPYDPDEFNRMAANKLLRPDIKTTLPDGRMIARFWHPAGADVPGLLNELFSQTHQKADELRATRATIGELEYRKQTMLMAADFYRRLVIIHPLWDGVGRTSKQMRDWVLEYMGFNPPASTPENDMELTTEQYAELLDSEVARSETEIYRMSMTQGATCLVRNINHSNTITVPHPSTP